MASMAVAEFQGQEWDPTDLAKFSTACSVNVTVDKTVGANSPQSCSSNPNACVSCVVRGARGVVPRRRCAVAQPTALLRRDTLLSPPFSLTTRSHRRRSNYRDYISCESFSRNLT